jgi:NitT/TauT family transport system substrate-binding protein
MKRMWGCVVLACVLACTGASRAQGLEKPNLVIAAGSTAGFVTLPLVLAQRLGYLKAEGLNVEIVEFAGGAKSLQAIMGGSADVVSNSYEHTIRMQAKGERLVAFVQQLIYPGAACGLRADLAAKYRSPKDLKGMKVGVTAPGSATHSMLNYLIARDGLKPEDVAVIGVGTGGGAVAAVQRNEIDAMCNIDPVMTKLELSGQMKIIAEMRNKPGTDKIFGGAMPGLAIMTRPDFIEKNPRTVQAMANAMVKTFAWLNQATPDQVANAIPPEYLQNDRTLWLEAFTRMRSAFSPDGLMPAKGPENTYEYLLASSPELRGSKVDLERTYDNSFVRTAMAARK